MDGVGRGLAGRSRPSLDALSRVTPGNVTAESRATPEPEPNQKARSASRYGGDDESYNDDAFEVDDGHFKEESLDDEPFRASLDHE